MARGKAKDKAIQDANDFIDQIRSEIQATDGTDLDNDRKAKNLHRSLQELSKQLYSKPTHFIAELIQNADDNTYPPSADPTLTLAYRSDGCLFVGCNEVGFDSKNVDAICSVADSTKKTTGAGKAYIGEKGIGFKSVFKVANVVRISSGNFSFSFNRDDMLGMIVPHNGDFPETKLVKDKTKFCLEIPDEDDRNKVKNDMQALAAEMLLFLRKLKAINVIIADENEKAQCSFKLSRQDVDVEASGTITCLTRTTSKPKKKEETENLTVFRRTATNMPDAEERKGITDSEIVIAFPHLPEDDDKDKPAPPVKKNSKRKYDEFLADELEKEQRQKSRKTYNFLPIRDLGLPFLLHADFLLTSSREEIIQGKPWNEKLKEEISAFFIQCVALLNKSSSLKFQWPRFMIAGHDPAGTIMEGFLKELRKQLCKENILESQSGDLKPPSKVFVPRESWVDQNNRPLLDDTVHLSQYISSKYPQSIIKSLVIREQLSKECATWLRKMSTANIHQKPAGWHSQLAKAIIEDKIDLKKISDLPLIPTRSGRWVDATTYVFFCEGAMIDIPEGIDCAIVADEAANDQDRSKLFRELGVGSITQQKVCEQIVKRHNSITATRTSGLELPNLVDHVWYLFKVKNNITDFKNLKLATADKGDGLNLVPVSSVYMDEMDGSFKMSTYFNSPDSPCLFLHPHYLAKAPPGELTAWYQWLRKELKVSAIPRLDSNNNALPPAFRYLIDEHPSSVWLTLFRDHWSHYSTSTSPLTAKSYGLGDQPVECTDGERRPLKAVYLRTEAIQRLPFTLESLHFVEIPDPEHPDWQFLGALGLGVRPDLPMYLNILRAAASNVSVRLSHADVADILRDLDEMTSDEPTLVDPLKTTLLKEALLPVCQNGNLTWHNLKECRWDVPIGVDGVVSLKDRYPLLKSFFTKTMGVRDTNVMDIAMEMSRKAGEMEHLESLRLLLLALSDLLASHPPEDHKMPKFLPQVLEKDVFPVKRSRGELRLASSKDETWFMADRDRLFQVFREKVWLLDYAHEDLKKLHYLFEYARITKFFLSQAAIEKTDMTGVPKRILEEANSLRTKAKFISMLVNEEQKDTVVQRTQGLHMYTVKELTLRWYVAVKAEWIFGKDEIGRASLDRQDDSLALYVLESSALAKELPWSTISDLLCEDLKVPADHKHALLSILTTSDHAQIRDMLDRKGLWNFEYRLDTNETPSNTGRGQRHSASASSKAAKRSSGDSTSPSLFVGDDEDDFGENLQDPKTKQSGRSQKSSQGQKPSKSTKSSNGPARRGGGGSTGAPPTYDESEHAQMLAMLEETAATFESKEITIYSADDAAEPSASDLLHPSFAPDLVDCGQQTRYLAELFVYRVLQSNFEIPEAAWTSELRSQFSGMELDDIDVENSATFTTKSPHITDWLINNNYTAAEDYVGTSITYHIDVKATTGTQTQFHLPTSRLELARQWRQSEEDVYIIFRVSEIGKNLTPKIQAYVDPEGLILSGKLRVAAKGGWAVQVG